jgi:hypothetical protein
VRGRGWQGERSGPGADHDPFALRMFREERRTA